MADPPRCAAKSKYPHLNTHPAAIHTTEAKNAIQAPPGTGKINNSIFPSRIN